MTDDVAGPDGSALSEGLGPLPEAGMTEANPYIDLGPLDPHRGVQILTWYSADQMKQYAAAAVAAERERCAQIADHHARRNYTWGSENSDKYHALADLAERIAAAIRKQEPQR